MAAAHAAWPAIDTWILASTRTLHGSVAKAITAYAEQLGWGLVALDWSEQSPGFPRLATLCAAFPDVVCEWSTLRRQRGTLEALAAAEGFATTRDALLAELRAVDIGFEAARAATKRDLERFYIDPEAARAIAGASPALLAQAPPVPRSGLRAMIEQWWATPVQTAVLLGIEGLGKTWGAIDALRDLSARRDGPLPIVIAAHLAGQTADGHEAVIAALSRIGNEAGLLLNDPSQFWRRRLSLWAKDNTDARPQLLVLVDGLDELDLFDWPTWLAPLRVAERDGLVRLLLTSRIDEWHHRIGLDGSEGLNVLPVDRFAATERDAYLRSRGIDPEQVSAVVLEAALHPRTAFHLTRLADELGDLTRITREQLLLRDFQNLCEIKGGPVGAEVFEALVRDLAGRAQDAALRQQAFQATAGDIMDTAADLSGGSRDQMLRVLGSLAAGTWLERDVGNPTRFGFTDKGLPDAVGFALSHMISGLEAGAALGEIDRFLEPWGADDLVEKVLRTCATALIVNPTIPDSLCGAVLERWHAKPMHGRAGHDFWRRLHIFRPQLFLDFCESHGGHGDWLVEWGVASLWEDHPSARPLVEARLNRWLTTIGIPAAQTAELPEDSAALNRERDLQIASLAALEAESPGVWTDRIGQASDSLPEGSARTAARIIGLLERTPFVPILRDWALSCAAAGRPAYRREVEALLRDVRVDDAEAAFAAVREAAAALEAEGSDLGRVAASYLLHAAGDPVDSPRADLLAGPLLTRRRIFNTVARVEIESCPQLVLNEPPRQRLDVIYGLTNDVGDPDATLAPELSAALAESVANLVPGDIRTLFEHDGRPVAVVLRWHTEAFFALLRRYLLVEPVPEDDGPHSARAEYRQIAMGALPVLTGPELDQLADRLEASAAADGDGLGAAAALRLAHRPLAEQVALLLDRPSAHWPRDYVYLLSRPSDDELATLVAGIDFGAPLEELTTKLSLAKALVDRFGPTAVSRDWAAAFGHADDDIRRDAMHLADDLDGEAAGRQFAALGIDANQIDDAVLAFEMSSLLFNLDDETLRPLIPRLDIETLGHVYLHRPGLRGDALPRWLAWMRERISVRRNSWGMGGPRVIYLDREAAFQAYVTDAPDDAATLLRSAWDDRQTRNNIKMDHGDGPTWPLLLGLATIEPALVKSIWRGTVEGAGSMWASAVESFPAELPAGPEFDDLHIDMLTRPKTDGKLFDAIRVLEKHGHRDTVIAWIGTELSATLPARRARAIAAAGFLDASDAAMALWAGPLAERPAGWLGEVHDVAKVWHRCARNARHWYLAMRQAENEEAALRAFWLLNRVADQRTWLFFKSEPYRIPFDSWRVQWLDFYHKAATSVRKAPAKELEKTWLHGERVNAIINSH